MRVLSAQRRGRPAIGATYGDRPAIEIDGAAIDYVAMPDRAAAGRALLAFAEMPHGQQQGMKRFAAGAMAGYVAHTIGQSGIGQGAIAASFAAAAAAYARADATAASDAVAPMPAARFSV
jgi:hypothetical protein